MCHIDKDDSEFKIAKKRNWTGLTPYCKDCKRQYDRDYWRKNNKKLVRRKGINKSLILDRNFELVANYLKTHPCLDCGETNIVVLEFDHVRGTKIDSVSQIVQNCTATKLLQEEIDKCEVRCANCHRIKTAKERNYRILKFLPNNTPK